MRDSQSAALSPIFGRLIWMLVGPMALTLLTFAIVSERGGWFTVFDVFFFVVLGVMFLGRWLEVRGGSPQTSFGEPATESDFRRYVLAASVGAPVVWVLANLLANHWLSD
jgi:hypothetical protein